MKITDDCIYGAVEWINDTPILDGMKAFKTKDECLYYIAKMKVIINSSYKVHYTIIKIETHFKKDPNENNNE